jgi:hypothetical protein
MLDRLNQCSITYKYCKNIYVKSNLQKNIRRIFSSHIYKEKNLCTESSSNVKEIKKNQSKNVFIKIL